MNIKIDGTWIGFYGYGAGYYRSSPTNFIANLVEMENEHFEGVIEDDVATGGLQALAMVIGRLTGSNIFFTKSYPSHSVIYEGIYEEDAEKFVGKWHIKGGFGDGNWEMKKGNFKNQEQEVAVIEVEMPLR